MIKRLVWTIIILLPIVAASFFAIITNNEEGIGNVFNAGAAIDWSWDAIQEFINLFNEEKRAFWSFLWKAIVAAFFIAPLIFVWRGLFFISWVPIVGDGIKAVVFTFIIFIPGIYEVLSSAGAIDVEFIDVASTYLTIVVVSLALIGLWLPKSLTTRKKKK